MEGAYRYIFVHTHIYIYIQTQVTSRVTGIYKVFRERAKNHFERVEEECQRERRKREKREK